MSTINLLVISAWVTASTWSSRWWSLAGGGGAAGVKTPGMVSNNPLRTLRNGQQRLTFKVMYDLPTGPVHIQEGGPFDNVTMLRDLVGNVTLVKDIQHYLGAVQLAPHYFVDLHVFAHVNRHT